MKTAGITIVGLGPGDPKTLTCQAREILDGCSEVFVISKEHPAIHLLSETVKVKSFDEHTWVEKFAGAGQTAVVDLLIQLGHREQGVVFAVPGHPVLDYAGTPEIIQKARTEGVKVEVIPGVSYLDTIYFTLKINQNQQVNVVDASCVAETYAPKFPPSVPTLILHVNSAEIARHLKASLSQLYPNKHPLMLVHQPGTGEELVEEVTLSSIDSSSKFGVSSAVYLPPLGAGTSFEDFLDVVAHLRSPQGCPWDREQTHQSLRATLLEETYEVLDTLDHEDTPGLQEELGDLLLQVYLHAQIAVDQSEFSMADILKGVYSKILRRHPHVFSQTEVDDVSGVLVNWERIKAEERAANGKPEAGLLDGVIRTLPALTQADQYLKRAARVGFDWPDLHSVLAKLQEELIEVDHAQNRDEKFHEIGDLLLAVVNLARWLDVDPESALREANLRFKSRFNYIERSAHLGGRTVSSLSLEQMEQLWQEAKNHPVG